jgi:hypothetical protein
MSDNEIENLAKKLFTEYKENLQALYPDVKLETINFILEAIKNT